ncbi:MAG TPA: Rieske 2Fe-2S domain-containing protein [Chitinophagaceae bacterium]|nr:Rieske 2Fe-2S domain-containing protein [Chitinophagaceae bacterium]
MDRKEFLAQLGLTSAAIFMGTCLGGCSKDDGGGGTTNVPPAPTGVDFTINLADAANSNLATPGGYIYKSGIIVARTLADTYIAVSQACTHQGFTVVFEGTNNRFYCSNHGSTFSTTGTVTTGPAGAPLTKYNTALTGTSLRVFS